MKQENAILAIDRGSKYIGLAYKLVSQNVVFPIGYLLNDQMIYFNIADVVSRYHVNQIILGWPSKQTDIQEKIDKFIINLNFVIDKEKVSIDKIEEDYTSVQSGEIVSNFKKNVAEDTISAMLILERRMREQKE